MLLILSVVSPDLSVITTTTTTADVTVLLYIYIPYAHVVTFARGDVTLVLPQLM
jgi:hypothetical protein